MFSCYHDKPFFYKIDAIMYKTLYAISVHFYHDRIWVTWGYHVKAQLVLVFLAQDSWAMENVDWYTTWQSGGRKGIAERLVYHLRE